MITELEKKLIRNIAENDYANGEPDAAVWSDCLDCGPCSIPIKSIAGVASSLSKKGLAVSEGLGWDSGAQRDDRTIQLTAKGLAVWRSL